MKVAVSVPNPIFDAAERLAIERRVPRSQVFSEALEKDVAKHDAAAVTAKLDAVYDQAVSAVGPALSAAQYAALSHGAW